VEPFKRREQLRASPPIEERERMAACHRRLDQVAAEKGGSAEDE
jgi:hypothetical protein